MKTMPTLKRYGKNFEMKSFRYCHNLYNKSDVLILTDVFENFTDLCIDNYGLDPAWYFTSPHLDWVAAMKVTKVILDLMTDPDMVLRIEHGVRRGICTISHRYGKANDPYMVDKFDPKQTIKYLQYLDANSLYGWAMSRDLPTGGFEWMTGDELTKWKDLCEKEGVGCWLEVNLEYPDELHDHHNGYPLAHEKMKVKKVEKLIPNLSHKTNYVVHYKALLLYKKLNLKITKIRRGIKFKERAWLKEYIDKNTKLQAKAKNDFEKDSFKLMNNSVCGKTMENVRNHVDIRLINTEDQAKIWQLTKLQRSYHI